MAAFQIVSFNENGALTLNLQFLKQILMREDVKNKQIAILSVAGDYRGGKSFLLDFFIRYFRYNRQENWLKRNTNEELTGFHWISGAEADTTGIWMWSEPLSMTSADGSEVMMFLMDTQGAFDSKQTLEDTARIFAFTGMVSSVMIFNLKKTIQSNNLQDLHYFTQYGLVALENETETPFNNLIFLVRDWQFIHDHKFGFNGGNDYLTKFLADFNPKSTQLQSVRDNLHKNFKELSCFLMSHPGEEVYKNEDFKGEIRLLEKEFLDCLNELIPCTINAIQPRNLTGEAAVEFISEYFTALTSKEMPEVGSLYDLTVSMCNRRAMKIALETFESTVEGFKEGDKFSVNSNELVELLELAAGVGVDAFLQAKRMGRNCDAERYVEELMSDVLRPRIDEIIEKNRELFTQEVLSGLDALLVTLVQLRSLEEEKKSVGIGERIARFFRRLFS